MSLFQVRNRLILYIGLAGVILVVVLVLMIVFSRTNPVGQSITELNASMEQLLNQQSQDKASQGKKTTTQSEATIKPSDAPVNTPINPNATSSNTSSNMSTSDQSSVSSTAPSPASSGIQSGTSSEAPIQASKGQVPSSADKLDINTATAEQFDELPGIGPSKAKEIVKYRDANKRFNSIDELTNVKGIGPKILEKLRSLVYVASS